LTEGTAGTGEPPVSAWRLCKRYGHVQALDEVAIDLMPGQVHAIVGENGAGKSTLAKCIAGAERPDSGAILVDGHEQKFSGRRDSIAAGVGYVPQALSLVGALTLAENLMVAREGILIDSARARADLDAAAKRLHTHLSVDVPTSRLSLAELQLAEIALALAQGARVLLLDEPTSTLGPVEVERLIACMRELASQGTAVGLVTHRIVEVLQGADRVTVLRGGKMVHHGPTAGLAANDLAGLIVGERSREVQRSRKPGQGAVRLRARGLDVDEGDIALLKGVDLNVAGGEIVGVAGVAGASQPALAQTLVGIRQPTLGAVEIDGHDITGDAARSTALKVAYVPDTRREGLVLHLNIATNASFMRMHEPGFQRHGLRVLAAEERYGEQICRDFDVRPPRPELLVAGLSGGNQQKLMVGREIEEERSVIVAHGPTQGLDLAASAAIRNRLAAAAEKGAAVVVISADLDEILTICDRIVVLASGRVTDTIDVREGKVDMVRLGRAMTDATMPAVAP
jgi:general nucleoside transport system ATP-binding protein